MTLKGYLKFIKKMWYAPVIWAGTVVKLIYDFLRSPNTFWPGDRDTDRIYQPVDGLTHTTLAGANGVRLHTVMTGGADKPLMLLLHGFPELSSMWDHQMNEFRKDFNVAAIDMRGYGRSDRPTARRDYYIDVLVEDVVAVVHALGYQKCVLAGHDWGGKVAWTVAHMHPKMIERLIIIAAPHPTSWTENFSQAQAKKSSYFQLFYAPWLAELFVLHNDVSLIDMSLVTPQVPAPINPDAISEEEIEHIKNSMCQGIRSLSGISSASAMLNYYRGWIDNETWHPVAAADEACAIMLPVDLPTMLLVGDSDYYFLPEMWQRLELHVTNCWLPRVLKNCSHWCPQDSPVSVNDHIRQFLSRTATNFQVDVGAPGTQ